MTLRIDVQTLFEDARAVHASALERLEAGDLRDAAEKAWCATLRATNALILARTGEEPEKTSGTSKNLDRLARQGDGVEGLKGRYYSRQTRLHGDCFYSGILDDVDEIARRISETAAYLDDAERLAA